MLFRRLRFPVLLALFFWSLFALHYYGLVPGLDLVSMLLCHPCYLLEAAVTASLMRLSPALQSFEPTLSQAVLALGFTLWAFFLTAPYWIPSEADRGQRKRVRLICWPLAALTLVGSLIYSLVELLRTFH